MKDIFTKYFWDEENVLFFSHFRDGYAIRQIEIWKDRILYLSEENPNHNGSMLYDGKFDELDLEGTEFITQGEFEQKWNEQF